jgi:putative endonuclease
MSNQVSGKHGEDIAVEYLKKQKYKILERNFRIRNGEIDIIAIDHSEMEPVLAFIEVKTRSSTYFGTPFEAITSWKMEALIRTSQVYKALHPKLPDLMRIDAVSVAITQGGEIVELLKDIS